MKVREMLASLGFIDVGPIMVEMLDALIAKGVLEESEVMEMLQRAEERTRIVRGRLRGGF